MIAYDDETIRVTESGRIMREVTHWHPEGWHPWATLVVEVGRTMQEPAED